MKIVITGGTGFLGLRLAQQILARGELTGPGGIRQPVTEVVLFDQTVPDRLLFGQDERIKLIAGDIASRHVVSSLIDTDAIGVFHLASVVSGGGEKDFDLAMRVNLHGGLHVFEALRARNGKPRCVFASSIAAFGGDRMDETVGDYSKQMPQTTYGVTKSIGELLINDYSRKGFFDGRTARLPTVIIRPGKPNAAASSFVSAVFREPLNGDDYVLPVTADTRMPVLGYRAIIDGLIAMYEMPAEHLGTDRAVQLPALSVSVQDMIDALKRVAASRGLGKITVEPDPFITEIVSGWPKRADNTRALELGLPMEQSLDEIVDYYIKDYVDNML